MIEKEEAADEAQLDYFESGIWKTDLTFSWEYIQLSYRTGSWILKDYFLLHDSFLFDLCKLLSETNAYIYALITL